MIDFQNVEKIYAQVPVLNKVSFRINPNERVGLVGPNGAGKSTIFNMITGEITPDSGILRLLPVVNLIPLRDSM